MATRPRTPSPRGASTAGDRIAVALRNSIEFFEIIVGAGTPRRDRHAGVVPPTSATRSSTSSTTRRRADRHRGARQPGRVPPVARRRSSTVRSTRSGSAPSRPTASPDQDGTALAPLRYYTSGTTGRPQSGHPHAAPRPGARARRRRACRAAQAAFNGPARAGRRSRRGPPRGRGPLPPAPGGLRAHGAQMGPPPYVLMDHFDAEEALTPDRTPPRDLDADGPHPPRPPRGGCPPYVQPRYDLSSMKRLMPVGALPGPSKRKAFDLFPARSSGSPTRMEG